MRDFSQRGFKKMLEAEEGIEPSNTGFANRYILKKHRKIDKIARLLPLST